LLEYLDNSLVRVGREHGRGRGPVGARGGRGVRRRSSIAWLLRIRAALLPAILRRALLPPVGIAHVLLPPIRIAGWRHTLLPPIRITGGRHTLLPSIVQLRCDPPPVPHGPVLGLLTLVDVEGFLQVNKIPSHGLVVDADVDLLQEGRREMQEDIVRGDVVVQRVVVVDIVHRIKECPCQIMMPLTKQLHLLCSFKLLHVRISRNRPFLVI
jgi:hypothetical protein